MKKHLIFKQKLYIFLFIVFLSFLFILSLNTFSFAAEPKLVGKLDFKNLYSSRRRCCWYWYFHEKI